MRFCIHTARFSLAPRQLEKRLSRAVHSWEAGVIGFAVLLSFGLITPFTLGEGAGGPFFAPGPLLGPAPFFPFFDPERVDPALALLIPDVDILLSRLAVGNLNLITSSCPADGLLLLSLGARGIRRSRSRRRSLRLLRRCR